MIKEFDAKDPEVTKFREKIFIEDLKLPLEVMTDFDNNPVEEKFAFWFSDKKFYTNGFDKVLLHYHNGEAVGFVGGTHFNKNLYRGVQTYYILKSARKIKGLNTLHFRPDGFFDWQINRAKELGCKAVFICFDLYDRKHKNMYYAMRNDLVGAGQMTNEERKYTAKDLVYLEDDFEIKYTKQKVCYHNITDQDIDFSELFYSDNPVS